MRWLIWMPLGAMLLIGAVLGFRTGWIAVNLDASQAISIMAERYMAESGAAQADCTAVPGDQVWLVIRCGSGQTRRVYRMNRLGWLVGPQDRKSDTILEPSI